MYKTTTSYIYKRIYLYKFTKLRRCAIFHPHFATIQSLFLIGKSLRKMLSNVTVKIPLYTRGNNTKTTSKILREYIRERI